MCIAPITLDNGSQVACRNCWQCKAVRIDDLVGRCIAESKTATAAHAVTLTYGRKFDAESTTYGEAEHERAAVLTYSDVQKFFKLLRFNGFPLRYFVAGEYGSRKGRAHWHVIIFWQGAVPTLPEMKKRTLWMRTPEAAWWPHGAVFFDNPEYAAFRYNMKYVLKDIDSEFGQTHYSFSKKPPLGADYFARKAERIAEQGLALNNLEYGFPEAVRRNGQRVVFRLHDRSAELYIEAYASAWRRFHGERHMPPSELVEEYFDNGSWRERLSPSGPLRMEPYKGRFPSPYDLERDLITGEEIQRGVIELRKRGVIVSNLDAVCRDAQGHSFVLEWNGELLTWGKGKSGEPTWRNVKGEKVLGMLGKDLKNAILAARESSEPWLIIPGKKPSRMHPRSR